jgi:hypothetical protein
MGTGLDESNLSLAARFAARQQSPIAIELRMPQIYQAKTGTRTRNLWPPISITGLVRHRAHRQEKLPCRQGSTVDILRPERSRCPR